MQNMSAQEPVVTIMVNPLPNGAFINIDETALLPRMDSVYVDDQDLTMNVQYLCACGLTVYELNGDNLEFGCIHCDSVCLLKGCERCKILMSVDFGAGDAVGGE